MFDILNTKLSDDAIKDKRKEVSKRLQLKSVNINSGTINTISAADLKLLFKLYDEIFLENWFEESFRGKLKFSLSRQMTKSAGLTRCPKNIHTIKPEEVVIEIKIGVDFFFHYGLIEGNKMVGGVDTQNSLEALQLVFEHELCHVIEFIHFGKSNCGRERFKTMAGSLFGHTESHHKLPTHRQIANQKLGLNIGDTVTFTYEGVRHTGILYNINKRATVMVRNENGPLADRQGRRYSKYYVPLKLLE
ncbi:MAG TPA: hypothetical protein VEG39_16570 [Clostridia bacterium]|nr:hypothetical protein [Clostridia bacterium]